MARNDEQAHFIEWCVHHSCACEMSPHQQVGRAVTENGVVLAPFESESKSLIKNTNAEQAQRFARANGDLYDEPPPFDDMPY